MARLIDGEVECYASLVCSAVSFLPYLEWKTSVKIHVMSCYSQSFLLGLEHGPQRSTCKLLKTRTGLACVAPGLATRLVLQLPARK